MKAFLQGISSQFQILQWIDIDGLEIVGNPPSHWIMAILLSIAAGFVLRLLKGTGIRRLQKLSEKTTTRIDDILVAVVQKTKALFLVTIALYIGLSILDLGSFDSVLDKTLVAMVLIQAGLWLTELVSQLIHSWHLARSDRQSISTAVIAMRFVAQVIIWSIVLLLMLDNLGVKVVSLLAGLGVGGIAIALAVQRVLGDILASVSIVLDRPFEIGDTIVVGDLTGTVEHIGLKTTRLRSVNGEELVFSNADLLDSRIRNLKRMKERRNVLTIGVTYQTPASLLEQVPEWFKEIVNENEGLRFDRAHLKTMGDYSLQFELVYWVVTPDYMLHMDIQQKILLTIIRKFQGHHIDFAYPTQTVFLPNASAERN